MHLRRAAPNNIDAEIAEVDAKSAEDSERLRVLCDTLSVLCVDVLF